MRIFGTVFGFMLASFVMSVPSQAAIEFSPYVENADANGSGTGSGQAIPGLSAGATVGNAGAGQGQPGNRRGNRRLATAGANSGLGGVGGGSFSITSAIVTDNSNTPVIDQNGTGPDNGSGGNTGGGTGAGGAATPEPASVILWSALVGIGCIVARSVKRVSA